jgi:glycosyltransferase involved in cell wall biosynthesis
VIRVAFVLQEPTPYRSPHLARIAADPELEVTVIYAARTVQRRTWSVGDEDATYLKGPNLPLARLLHHDYPLTPGVWPLLSRLQPNVVVIGGWSTSATQLALLWCRRHRVPYLLMSDNHLREPRPAWVRALKRRVLKRLVPQAAGWLVPGRLAREHMAYYGADESRTVEFPLTIDVPAMLGRAKAAAAKRDDLRRRLGVDPNATMILTVGRLIELKSPDVLLTAAGRAQALSDAPLHVVLAGDGPLAGQLRGVAAALDVPVTFVGFVEGDELEELYAAADVFALLSHREPWGVVVNEAMCFGLPLVLSSAVGAGADLLEPGANGYVVAPGDVDAAARAFVQLANDPERCATFGRRSRELIEPWGFERGVRELTALLHGITAGR